MNATVRLDRDALAAFCRKWRIREFSLFGSVLRRDFRPDSDVDVLVEFEPGRVPGLISLAGIEFELSAMLGEHRVEMHTPLCLSKYFRADVLAKAEALYVAP